MEINEKGKLKYKYELNEHTEIMMGSDMHVIYKAPGSRPEPWDIPNTLEELQATVGGRIETVTLAADAAVI